MKRREILKYTILATGAAVSAPLLSSILSGCSTSPEKGADYQTQFFSKEDFELVTKLIDTILPKTDSPSASEVGVDRTIDAIVGAVYKQKDKEDYAKRFSAFAKYLKKESGKGGFISLSDDKKLAILQQLGRSKEEGLKEVRNAYLDFKQQTIAFYLSSEEIGENYLNYLPVPGAYEACIALKDVGGKAWSI